MSTEVSLLVIVILSGFYMAWNIGANDVANAMGTSVGSGCLTLRQAVLVAAILEFCGAYFFGSYVSKTLQEGIVRTDIFQDAPLQFVYGMLSCLLGAGLWLQIATYFGLPVSTTHSIVGAVIGFGAIVGGVEGVYWTNVAYIAFSWILSPLSGCVLAFFIFNLLRKNIFYSHHPLKATVVLTPFLVFAVIMTFSLVIVSEILQKIGILLNVWQDLLLSFFLGCMGALIGYFSLRGITLNLKSSHQEHEKIERIFGFLQIMSACLMAFAHGANDVANAIGPLSAAVSVILHGSVNALGVVPPWALALGGVGIVVGLATWGWRVIETIGKKITELTPSRGFVAEFATAVTILIASRLGLPISTTHTLVGSVLGVGFARGIEALNLNTIRDIVLSWIVTIPAGAVLSIGIYFVIDYIF